MGSIACGVDKNGSTRNRSQYKQASILLQTLWLSLRRISLVSRAHGMPAAGNVNCLLRPGDTTSGKKTATRMGDTFLRVGFLPISLLFLVSLSVMFSSAEGFALVSSCVSCNSGGSSVMSSMFLFQPWGGGEHSTVRTSRGSFSGRVGHEGGGRARSYRRGRGAADGMRMQDPPAKKGKGPYKVIANNKKARRNYEIMEKFEAGIELVGSEVKSCRLSKINMDEGFAQAKNGQCFLHGVHIAECAASNRFYQHEPKRPRRLLLHKREIKRLQDKMAQKGMTVVPLKIFFNDDNRLKVEIALAQGKNVRDKREDIKDRDAKRDMQRITKNAYD